MKTRTEELTDLLAVFTSAEDGVYHREIEEIYAELKRELEVGSNDELNKIKKAKDHPVYYLSGLRYYSTKDLMEELVRREGVEGHTVYAHGGKATLCINNGIEGSNDLIEGPARILVNKD